MGVLFLKRVYLPKDESDGFRVLVDRLWPRGLKREDAAVDLWLKDIGPSADLRKWFDHDPEKWEEFSADYGYELRRNPKTLETLRNCLRDQGKITLLYAAKDEQYNNAVVVKAFLEQEGGI